MKGKKIDTEFLSDYIQDCVMIGISSNDEIVEQAKNDIAEIDEEIKAIEISKVRRSKLLGVIASLDNVEKPSKKEEAKLLPFYKLNYPRVCNALCSHIQLLGPFLDETCWEIYDRNDETTLSIKQLLEHKIIDKSGQYFVRGKAFDDYIEFMRQNK